MEKKTIKTQSTQYVTISNEWETKPKCAKGEEKKYITAHEFERKQKGINGRSWKEEREGEK